MWRLEGAYAKSERIPEFAELIIQPPSARLRKKRDMNVHRFQKVNSGSKHVPSSSETMSCIRAWASATARL